MVHNTKVFLVVGLLIFSAAYSLLIHKDEELARTIALGYIAAVLTMMFIIKFWKRKE